MNRVYKYIIINLFLGLILQGYSQTETCMTNISSEEFKVKIDSFENEIIIDVRHADLIKEIIIEKALLLSTRNELNKFADTLDRETPIFVYCAIGERSIAACKLLCEMGFQHVSNLKKGIEEWERMGYKVVNPENEKK